MYIKKEVIDVTTDATGNATAYSPIINGRILSVIYTKDGSNPFAVGVDFNITLEDTPQPVWAENNVDASATRSPRQVTHGTDGAPLLYAATGTNVEGYIAAANERVKFSISAGGNAKSGRFTVIVG
jgi:hypothetical protein